MYVCFVKYYSSDKKYLFDCSSFYGLIKIGKKVVCEGNKDNIAYIISKPIHIDDSCESDIIKNSGAYLPLKKIVTVIDKINLCDIKISYKFAVTIPNSNKIKKCIEHYKKYKTFSKPIILNKKDILVDGYVVYLVAKMLGFEKVTVRYDIK